MIEALKRERYSEVVVCRHNKDGTFAVRASAPVPNAKPAAAGTSLWLTEFPGTASMAMWVADAVARVVAH